MPLKGSQSPVPNQWTLTIKRNETGAKNFLPMLDSKYLKKVEKCGVVEEIVFSANIRQMKALGRQGGST